MTRGGSSIPEVRALLAALVASKPAGRVAEAGTAYGEGASAIVAGLGPEATFVTVEPDPERHRKAVAALRGTRTEVVLGRWEDELASRAPFDLLFFDGGMSETALTRAIELLAPGGMLIKDDLTPGRPIDGDLVRETLLRDERLAAVEVLTAAESAAIIAVRRA